MIPQALKNGPPGRPEHFRLMLIVFSIRHILGVALFVYLIKFAYAGGGSFWVVLLALTVLYAAYAIYNGFRLFGQFKRTSRRRQQSAERSRAAGSGAT